MIFVFEVICLVEYWLIDGFRSRVGMVDLFICLLVRGLRVGLGFEVEYSF